MSTYLNTVETGEGRNSSLISFETTDPTVLI